MPDSRPEQERHDHAAQCHQEGRAAGLAHALDVRLDACDEHEHETADLGEQHQRAGRLPSFEEVKVQEVQGPRTKGDADQQLSEDGRYSEAIAQRSGDLHRRKHDGDQQRELKCRLHRRLWFCRRQGIAGAARPEPA